MSPRVSGKAGAGSGFERQRTALVLQGGGALGAYQAGVYQALHEHELAPDWVIGTSIGAINGAIIAGNPPAVRLQRLKQFWDTLAHADLFNLRHQINDEGNKLNAMLASMDAFTQGVPGMYSPRLCNPFALGLPVAPDAASFYDTSELAHTLARLVDLPYLNSPEGTRLTISATKVTSGNQVSFDNRHQTIGIEHIMASGALPPGFPPIRIDGDLYWDGGLYSNTPLEIVLEEEPRVDTLCFMVDLWSGAGPEPGTLQQVQTRQKDIVYASRSQQHIDDYLRLHRMRRTLRSLYAKLPAELMGEEDEQALAELGSDSTIHIVRLAYSGRDWQMAAKDVNFSRGSIGWRWEQGYQDALRAKNYEDWFSFAPAHAGLVVHEVGPHTHSATSYK